MKVYGGGYMARMYGQDDKQPEAPKKLEPKPELKPVSKPKPKPKKVYDTTSYAYKVGLELRNPDSKYHGTASSTCVPVHLRCDCPKCKQALANKKKADHIRSLTKRKHNKLPEIRLVFEINEIDLWGYLKTFEIPADYVKHLIRKDMKAK